MPVKKKRAMDKGKQVVRDEEEPESLQPDSLFDKVVSGKLMYLIEGVMQLLATSHMV